MITVWRTNLLGIIINALRNTVQTEYFFILFERCSWLKLLKVISQAYTMYKVLMTHSH